MNCEKVKKSLVFFLENDLPQKQRIEMEEHLKTCPYCSGLLEEFSQLWGTLEQREKIPPSPYFWTRLKARIVEYEEGRKPAWGWLGGLVRWTRPAMALAVLLVCIFTGYNLGNIPSSANGQTANQTDQRTAALEQFFVSYNLDPLVDLPAGSIGATYLDMVSGK